MQEEIEKEIENKLIEEYMQQRKRMAEIDEELKELTYHGD